MRSSRFAHFFLSIEPTALLLCHCVCLAAARADLLINEVDADQSGSDSAEFLELYDGGLGNTSLDGYIVVLYNGSQDTVYRTIDLAGHVTSPDGYFVLANPGVPGADLLIDPGESGAIQNGPDAITLYQRSADDFPRGAGISAEGLIDALVYGTGDPDDLGLLAALAPGQLQIDDSPEHSMSRIPDGGTPFDSASYASQPPSPGRSNVVTESLMLSLSADSVLESAGSEAIAVTVTRTGPTTSVVTVAVRLDDFTELIGPPVVTMAAGQSAIRFSLTAVDDAWADGPQQSVLAVSAPGYREATTQLRTWDDPDDGVGMIVNEVYADDREDANRDQEGPLDGPGSDEFIEFVNASRTALDLAGHTLHDAVALRHRFPDGTVVEPGCALLVFGGGNLEEGFHPLFGGALVQRANAAGAFGLGLNNSGDTVRVVNPAGVEIAGFRYDAEHSPLGSGSLVRSPDLSDTVLPHRDVESLGDGARNAFSPGLTVEGIPFCKMTWELHLAVEPPIVAENSGENASTLTITRNGPVDEPLRVRLTASDHSEVRLPDTAEIPEGSDSVQVSLHAVDDLANDGDVLVSITALATSYVNGRVQIQILDDGDPPPNFIINELDPEQAGEDDREFIELYDGGVGHLPLDGLLIVLFNGAKGGESYAGYDLTGQTSNAEGFFVLGDPAVAHVAWAISNFHLQNGPDGVALYRGLRGDFPRGAFPREDGLLDAVTYGAFDAEATDLDTLTPGQSQALVGLASKATSIGRQPDGGEPRINRHFRTLTPTPGTANIRAAITSYATWTTDFDNPGEPGDDPDHDGWPNLLEYVVGSHPLKPNPDPPLTITPLAHAGSLAIRFPLTQPLPDWASGRI